MPKPGWLLCFFFLFPLFLLPAAGYADLPQSHWAYADMTRAAELGILQGYEDGTMQPEAHLTWGQCLTMLGRSFYAAALSTQAGSGSRHWATGAYSAAISLGVVEQSDFLPLTVYNLDSPVSRQDMAVLLDRTLSRVSGAELADLDGEALPADFSALPEPYRVSVLQCGARGVIKGYDDGRFGGSDLLSRAAGATLLVRALGLTGDAPAVDNGGKAEESPPPPTATRPGPLTALDSNADKRLLIYGDANQTRFSCREEAEAKMVKVTVPVWRLNRPTGEKTPSQLSFSIHSALAEDMAAIFTEIFNDPERFPIYSIGGYAWRGDSSKSEHNLGTALDINYIENYQVSPEGSIYAGACWLPGENPWSIPPDGSVVRIFNAHGYTWGGNGWPDHTPKDYMHFSYLGR